MSFFQKLGLIALLVALESAPASQDVLKEYGILIPSTFKVLKDQKVSGTKLQRTVEFEGPKSERIEIKILAPVEATPAAAMIASESDAVRKLYAAPQTPYMGDIAQAIGSCPAKYGPVKSDVQFLSDHRNALIGAANSQRAFGACSASEAKFRGGFMSYYDPSTKTVWSWRVFVPWSDKKPLGDRWLSEILAQFSNEISVH